MFTTINLRYMKYIKQSDIIKLMWNSIILWEITPRIMVKIQELETIDIDEPREISIEKAKAFADYYRNDVLNRDDRSIDVHFNLFTK